MILCCPVIIAREETRRRNQEKKPGEEIRRTTPLHSVDFNPHLSGKQNAIRLLFSSEKDYMTGVVMIKERLA